MNIEPTYEGGLCINECDLFRGKTKQQRNSRDLQSALWLGFLHEYRAVPSRRAMRVPAILASITFCVNEAMICPELINSSCLLDTCKMSVMSACRRMPTLLAQHIHHTQKRFR